MHRYDFNADMRHVYARLAEKHNAGVAESNSAPPVRENTQVEILSPAPQIDER